MTNRRAREDDSCRPLPRRRGVNSIARSLVRRGRGSSAATCLVGGGVGWGGRVEHHVRLVVVVVVVVGGGGGLNIM